MGKSIEKSIAVEDIKKWIRIDVFHSSRDASKPIYRCTFELQLMVNLDALASRRRMQSFCDSNANGVHRILTIPTMHVEAIQRKFL